MYRFHSARYLSVLSFARWSNPMRFLCVMHRLLNRSLITQNIISVLMCHSYQFCVMIFSCSRKSISLMTLLRHRLTSPSKDRSDTRASDNVRRRSLRCYIFTLRKCLAREMDQATHFQWMDESCVYAQWHLNDIDIVARGTSTHLFVLLGHRIYKSKKVDMNNSSMLSFSKAAPLENTITNSRTDHRSWRVRWDSHSSIWRGSDQTRKRFRSLELWKLRPLSKFTTEGFQHTRPKSSVCIQRNTYWCWYWNPSSSSQFILQLSWYPYRYSLEENNLASFCFLLWGRSSGCFQVATPKDLIYHVTLRVHSRIRNRFYINASNTRFSVQNLYTFIKSLKIFRWGCSTSAWRLDTGPPQNTGFDPNADDTSKLTLKVRATESELSKLTMSPRVPLCKECCVMRITDREKIPSKSGCARRKVPVSSVLLAPWG